MNISIGNTQILQSEDELYNFNFNKCHVGTQFLIFKQFQTRFDYINDFYYNDFNLMMLTNKKYNGALININSCEISHELIEDVDKEKSENDEDDEENYKEEDYNINSSYFNLDKDKIFTLLCLKNKNYVMEGDYYPYLDIDNNNNDKQFISHLSSKDVYLTDKGCYMEQNDDKAKKIYHYLTFKLNDSLKISFLIKYFFKDNTISKDTQVILMDECHYTIIKQVNIFNGLLNFMIDNFDYKYAKNTTTTCDINPFLNKLKIYNYAINDLLNNEFKCIEICDQVNNVISFYDYKKILTPICSNDGVEFYFDIYNLTSSNFLMLKDKKIIDYQELNVENISIANYINTYFSGCETKYIDIFTGETLRSDIRIIYKDTKYMVIDSKSIQDAQYYYKVQNIFIKINKYFGSDINKQKIKEIDEKMQIFEKLKNAE